MKKAASRIFITLLLVVVLPGLMLRAVEKRMLSKQKELESAETETIHPTDPTEGVEQIVETKVLMGNGTVTYMDEDAYITGVLLAEMPVSFQDEALKAQAVVARTYVRKQLATGVKHANNGVCTDSGCCQGYRSPDDFLRAGGSEIDLERVRELVRQTRNEVLCYDGALIEATYFSCSGGKTEDAVAVWGTQVPYLQAKDSPGEEQATHFTDTVRFQSNEFLGLLQLSTDALPGSWFGNITYTAGGGVDTMQICGKTFSGTDLRRILGLRSTAFQMTAVGQTITVTTRGFGHRVGMSQYGAEAMAVDGSTYQQILEYYYPGTILQSLGED